MNIFDPNKELEVFILHELTSNPYTSQRSLSEKFNISLGKVNFILKELAKKGYIKVEKFAKSENKLKYRYILTPSGIKAKIKITKEFIKKKMEEYEKLLEESEE